MTVVRNVLFFFFFIFINDATPSCFEILLRDDIKLLYVYTYESEMKSSSGASERERAERLGGYGVDGTIAAPWLYPVVGALLKISKYNNKKIYETERRGPLFSSR